MLGKTLAHYKILEKLGEGGMGEVYAAEDTKLGRRIALKILPEELAKDPERLKRFELEARSIAALNHPNIVTIFSVEEAGGVHFITMELVEGKNLSEAIPKNGMTLEKIFEIAIPLADAVSTAHNAGITHRDLKPANVMIGNDGRLRVLDFGLAKLVAGAEADRAGAVTMAGGQDITSEGKIVGTVAYMSPEQAEGKPIDQRSDIFSTGVMLYEMATGDPPFKGDTHISTISSIIREEPTTVTELRQNLPRHLGRIVKRCLAKAPDRRYQTAIDLRNELQELKGEIDSGDIMASEVAVATARPSSNRNLIAAGIAVVAVVVVAGVFLLTRMPGRDSGGGTADAYPGIEMTRVTRTGKSIEAAISPNGRYVAHMVRDAGKLALHVTQLSTSSTVEIIPATDAYIFDPTFSLDGEFVYYCRRERIEDETNDLYRIPVLGGEPRRVAANVNGTVSFSPDGGEFAFLGVDNATNSTSVVVAAADGSQRRALSTKTFPNAYAESPAWSPDGKVIAAPVSNFDSGIESYLVEIPLEGGEERKLWTKTLAFLGEIAWLPDGSGVIGVVFDVTSGFNGQLWEISYPEGAARRLTTDLNTYDGVSVTTDAMSLVTALEQPAHNVWIVTPGEETAPRQITAGGDQSAEINQGWTPDGKIVFQTDISGTLDIWISNADGSGQRQLTSDAGVNVAPAVSPDGRYIVFISTRSGSVQIWRMESDGSTPTQLTTETFAVNPDISPDGRWIIYQGDSSHIYRVPLEGGGRERITGNISSGGRISPDGDHIAYRYWDDQQKTMLMSIIPFDGGEPVATITMRTGNYRWAPDGNAIHFAIEDQGTWDIWSQPLDGGQSKRLTDYRFADDIGSFAWSPDGRQLALTLGQTKSDIVLMKEFRQ
jgi:Tol biopolymer transport system component/predicted Ser/Thr protein kinase